MKALWDPFQDMEDLLSTFDRSFGRRALPGGKSEGGLTLHDWTPAVDISETDEEYLIKFELPEVQKDDITVSIENGVLTVTGERKVEKEEKTKKKFHRVERFYGTFSRSFSLPDDVDEPGIHADYKDGVLNLHLEKTETPEPKALDVKVD